MIQTWMPAAPADAGRCRNPVFALEMIQTVITKTDLQNGHRSQSSIRPGDDSDEEKMKLTSNGCRCRNPVFALEMIQTYLQVRTLKELKESRNPVFALEMIQTFRSSR